MNFNFLFYIDDESYAEPVAQRVQDVDKSITHWLISDEIPLVFIYLFYCTSFNRTFIEIMINLFGTLMEDGNDNIYSHEYFLEPLETSLFNF